MSPKEKKLEAGMSKTECAGAEVDYGWEEGKRRDQATAGTVSIELEWTLHEKQESGALISPFCS